MNLAMETTTRPLSVLAQPPTLPTGLMTLDDTTAQTEEIVTRPELTLESITAGLNMDPMLSFQYQAPIMLNDDSAAQNNNSSEPQEANNNDDDETETAHLQRCNHRVRNRAGKPWFTIGLLAHQSDDYLTLKHAFSLEWNFRYQSVYKRVIGTFLQPIGIGNQINYKLVQDFKDYVCRTCRITYMQHIYLILKEIMKKKFAVNLDLYYQMKSILPFNSPPSGLNRDEAKKWATQVSSEYFENQENYKLYMQADDFIMECIKP